MQLLRKGGKWNAAHSGDKQQYLSVSPLQWLASALAMTIIIRDGFVSILWKNVYILNWCGKVFTAELIDNNLSGSQFLSALPVTFLINLVLTEYASIDQSTHHHFLLLCLLVQMCSSLTSLPNRGLVGYLIQNTCFSYQITYRVTTPFHFMPFIT